MLQDIIKQALPGLETLLAAIGSLLLAYATRFIAAHAKNATVAGIMTRTVDLVSVVVAEAEQTIVGELKANGATLTKPDAARVMGDVLAKLKGHLGPKGIAELEKVFQPAQIQSLLVSLIEAEVAKQKQFGPIDVPPPAVGTVQS